MLDAEVDDGFLTGGEQRTVEQHKRVDTISPGDLKRRGAVARPAHVQSLDLEATCLSESFGCHPLNVLW